jgi:hypothetical protein
MARSARSGYCAHVSESGNADASNSKRSAEALATL